MPLDKLELSLARANDLAPTLSQQPDFCLLLWPQIKLRVFIMAVKWAPVVNLLMMSPFHLPPVSESGFGLQVCVLGMQSVASGT